CRPAVMDLVARDPCSERGPPALPGHLLRLEDGVDVEPSEAPNATATRLDVVQDRLTEHLISAAQTEHHGASATTRSHGVRQTSRPQPFEVGHGGLGSG